MTFRSAAALVLFSGPACSAAVSAPEQTVTFLTAEALAPMEHGPMYAQAEAAVAQLARIGSGEAVEALGTIARQSRDPILSLRAVEKLGELGGPHASRELASLIEGRALRYEAHLLAIKQLRDLAMAAMAASGDAAVEFAGERQLIKTMTERAARAGTSGEAHAALQVLKNLRSPAACDALSLIARYADNPQVGESAARLLAEIPRPSSAFGLAHIATYAPKGPPADAALDGLAVWASRAGLLAAQLTAAAAAKLAVPLDVLLSAQPVGAADCAAFIERGIENPYCVQATKR